MARIRREKRENLRKEDLEEPQKYRYIISENIPNRDEIITHLLKSDLLYKK